MSKTAISITIDSDLLAQIDAWIKDQPLPGARSKFFEDAARSRLDMFTSECPTRQKLNRMKAVR